jgi:enamine deaminase RidA (YjgF/YER057c/UK114 family)
MNIQRFDPGARMSQAVVYNGFVFLAGQVGEGADVTAQTKDILASVDSLLARAGSDKTKLLSATLPAGQGPARATVESKLAGPEYKVEIGIIAAVG